MNKEIKDKIFENIKEKEIKRSIKLHIKKYGERFKSETFQLESSENLRNFIDFDTLNKDLVTGIFYERRNTEYHYYNKLSYNDFNKLNKKDIDALINEFSGKVNKNSSSLKYFVFELFKLYVKKHVDKYVERIEYSLLNW